MLILTRRIGETVLVGPDIKVYLISTQGNQARLGFEAPSGVHIYREELLIRRIDDYIRKSGIKDVDIDEIRERIFELPLSE